LVLGDVSHLDVTNLALPGATASSALAQEQGIKLVDSLVLIEIGGNDSLGGVSSDQFFKDLDELLAGIPSTCSCVMFELPLFPFQNGYGEAQRTLARKHHVVMIPRKCLTAVIGASGNTLDGLHLSQKGHDALALSVFSMLAISR
jgi:acyl-CoA thioesterase-1